VQFVPLFPPRRMTVAHTIVKPMQANRHYTFMSQMDGEVEDDGPARPLDDALNAQGFPNDVLEAAMTTMMQPRMATTTKTSPTTDAEAEKERDEMWEIIREQRELQKITFQKYAEANGSK